MVWRMDEYRMSIEGCRGDIGSGRRVQGRQRLGRTEGAKVVLYSKWITVEAA